MIQNPILPGFNPDPCLCRQGDDYYLAVSSFEWLPGVPVYHSRDLKHWELYTHILTDDTVVNLQGLPSALGIWAPCLTWCQADGLFYLVYGIMHSQNGGYFDIDNYLITAPQIIGPWSKPVYLQSSGFDASLFHDEDGRKYLVSLEWETRDGYEKPGAICLAEYDPASQRLLGLPRRIWNGGTDRGCLEAPHLTKHEGMYYLMCAEGGTGYYHSVTMGRAARVDGPYQPDPANPIVTSSPGRTCERQDLDYLKPRYYNPGAPLQKCGHGSYVELPTGEVYLAHLCARPFVPELRCTLGRETALQKMCWTRDGWLRMADGSNLAKAAVPESGLPPCPMPALPARDDFDAPALGKFYYAPRQMPHRFADVTVRPGWLRLRGGEALTSPYRASLLARKLTGVYVSLTTRMEFCPVVYQHSAGLVLYYDSMNYLALRKYYSQTLGGCALAVLRLQNGCKTEYRDTRVAVGKGPLLLRLVVEGRRTRFWWRRDEGDWQAIGPVFDTSEFSDEFSRYGEFTGTMAGVFCEDRVTHSLCADFDFLEYQAEESRPVQ